MVTKDKEIYGNNIDNHIRKSNEMLNIIPREIRKKILNLPRGALVGIEEIRLRVNKPLMLTINNQESYLNKSGYPTKIVSNALIVTETDIKTCFRLATEYSTYALEEEIKNGFITIKGGHRVGICGKSVIQSGEIKTIKNISSINVRMAKEVLGCSSKALDAIIVDEDTVHNTLIISPPQCGKTTLLRDIVRVLSNGSLKHGFKGCKISVVDERSEIGACYNGVPQNDLGLRTDVLDGCPKALGMMTMIRSMSPSIVVTDEIGRDEDKYALKEAISAGVTILTTVHGYSVADIMRRGVISELIRDGVFSKFIILSNKPRVGSIREVLDIEDVLRSVKESSYAS